jgi:two-component system, OmpR family, sensor histidine kinase CpxA
MKPRLTLSAKVFLLAFLNLLLLAGVFLVFMRVQFRLDVGSFLLSPAQDRILAVGRQLALELRDTDPAGWNQLLTRYAEQHGVELYLVDRHGMQLAGPEQGLPVQVVDRFAHENHHRAPESPLLFLGTTGAPARNWVGVRIPVPQPGELHSSPGVLVVGSLSSLEGNLFFFDPKPWLAVGTAIILISVACWLPFVRNVTRSVSHITRATARIAEGQFNSQLPVTRSDELGQLSCSINHMASRLSGFVNGQKQFLRDAAHELCSPIARIQVGLGILEQSTGPDQRSCVADLREDIQHMSGLVNEVLSFSKASIQSSEARIEPVDLAAMTARVVDREAVNGVRITTAVGEQTMVLAEPDLLFRALSNVLRNAIRYAGNAGPIQISAGTADGEVAIRVSDCGPGLAEKDLEAVFEPFYRPAVARERDTGGVGLGLAIVKTCIESCQGEVHCRNRVPTGLEVEIRLKQASASG